MFAESMDTNSVEQIQDFMEESIKGQFMHDQCYNRYMTICKQY